MGSKELSERVVRSAAALLAEKGYVAPVDVLVNMGWLAPARVQEWRQGRVTCLERVVDANLNKISDAMRLLGRWALDNGLQASETAYVARTRDRRRLQFSVTGKAEIELAYGTHWVSSALSEAKRRRLAEAQSRPPRLVVVSVVGEFSCTQCSGSGDFILMEGDGPLCMDCADLGHLVFLPRGDAALTRRAKKASGLSAVVVRFSRARKRYERQGVLVEPEALEQAELECLEDQDLRLRRRVRDEQRRAGADRELEARFAASIANLFPGCPPERAAVIAAHAASRGSGCVGRSAAGRALDPEAVTLAVVASVRHRDTRYDKLLMAGGERAGARAQVLADVERVLNAWRSVVSDASG
jgi:hypothetical protein